MSISSISGNSYDMVYQQMEINSAKEYGKEAEKANEETKKANNEVWAEYAQGN